ncbi:MAG: DUF503 domain-containing protein [Acidimicrobiales bacterium]
MFVLALEVEIHIGESHSLKDRRQAVRPVLDGARRRFGVSVAEVGGQDSWQRATLGFVVVASSPSQATEVIDAVERFVWSHPELEVTSAERTWME